MRYDWYLHVFTLFFPQDSWIRQKQTVCNRILWSNWDVESPNLHLVHQVMHQHVGLLVCHVYHRMCTVECAWICPKRETRRRSARNRHFAASHFPAASCDIVRSGSRHSRQQIAMAYADDHKISDLVAKIPPGSDRILTWPKGLEMSRDV